MQFMSCIFLLNLGKSEENERKPLKHYKRTTLSETLPQPNTKTPTTMLSRAFTKPKKSPKQGLEEDNGKSESTIFYEYEDCIVGFMDDLPLVVIGSGGWRDPPSLREILRASAGWMGESCLGMTEKVVFVGGRICIAKRFRQVKLRRAEFGRRVVRMAAVSAKCEHLVPVTAYLYTKRLKFVLCDYYPMGSLADLLTGNSE